MWTRKEIDSILTGEVMPGNNKTLAELFCHYYGVEENGNVQPHQVSHALQEIAAERFCHLSSL